MNIQRTLGGIVLIAAIVSPAVVEAQVVSMRVTPRIVIVPHGESSVSVPIYDTQSTSATYQVRPPSFGTLTQVSGGFLYSPNPGFWVRGSDSFEWSARRDASSGSQVFILAEHHGFLEHREPFSSQTIVPGAPWEVIDGQYVELVDSPEFGSRVLAFTMGYDARPQIRIKAKGGGGNSGTRVTFDTDPEPYAQITQSGLAQFPMVEAYDYSGQKIWWITVRSVVENQDIFLQMRAETILMDGSVRATNWTDYPDDITQLRFHWWPSSSVNAGDGGLLLTHGEVPMARATGLHILPADLDEVHLGILEPVTELSGKIYVDDFDLLTGVEPPQLVPLFADGGEAGRLGDWEDTSSPLIAPVSTAAHDGNHGISFDLSTTATNVSLTDDRPLGERHLRLRFDFKATDLIHPSGNSFGLVTVWDAAKSNPVFRARFLTTAGGYALNLFARDDSGTVQNLPWILVETDSWNEVEIQWWSASEFGTGDGGLRLWLGGQLKAERLDLYNSSDRVQRIDVGARALDPGTSGTLQIDNYESRY